MRLTSYGFCAAALLAADPARAVVTFTDVTTDAGITHVVSPVPALGEAYMSGGAAAGDYDGDGWVDILFQRLDAPHVLYRNQRDGTFEDVSTEAGFTAIRSSSGAAWGDIDNDGDQDLYLTGMKTLANFLYINDGQGHFTEEALARGAEVPPVEIIVRHGMSVAMGDYDRDGYLDILTSEWGAPLARDTSRLLRNRGAAEPGAFDDVTSAVGLDQYREGQVESFRFTPHFTDLDRDGHTDIIYVSDFETSQLFWNRGDGTFMDGTLAAGVGTDKSGMGSTLADYDGDGDLDWFVTAIHHPPSDPGPADGNRLYINNGDRTFTDGTDFAGVRDAQWGWGTGFFDFDNDGDLDLMATNGYRPDHLDDPTVLFENDGDGTFTEVTTLRGIADNDLGRGLVQLDYDNDGDLDVLVINQAAAPVLYRNDGGNDNHYLRVETEGSVSNRDGIGAIIEVTADSSDPDQMLLWVVDGGSSFLSHHQKTAHFGLADHSGTVDLVEIFWPSGIVQRFQDVPVDSVLQAVEPYIVAIAGDANNDEQVTGVDLITVQANFGTSGMKTGLLLGDTNGDGLVTGVDLITVQENYGSVLEASPVPEPATMILLGMTGLWVLGRGRWGRQGPSGDTESLVA